MSNSKAIDRSGTPLVDMRDICISFGGVHAVDHVSVDLYPGEVVGLLGHNGAGKSTLLKATLGIVPAVSGSVAVFGQPLQPPVDHGSGQSYRLGRPIVFHPGFLVTNRCI